eukprot:CAMPEP_0115431788 /NCGR_PEP_ID=MMETSP0271-20121206/31754_1 /TAXON_ID=71861 /ORGANISM="Scrippsiella trochoidea, Strain CCMP3099" /LENGTH=1046 /DNA_ID=CAMNT_0002857085 /DNA_START=146 /DNA_END=3284 /DNA_ORIENTATION=+
MDTLAAIALPVWESVHAALAPMWVEICFMLCFIMGFLLLRFDLMKKGGPAVKKQKKVVDDAPAVKTFDPRLQKAVDAEAKPSAILAIWRAGRDQAPTPVELMRAVVQAFVDEDPDRLVTEVLEHVRSHLVALGSSRLAVVVLDVVARAGMVEAMTELARALRHELLIASTLQTYEVLLGGFATAGDERRVAEVAAEMSASRVRMSARGLSLTIKGFLKNGMVTPVIQKFKEMRDLGFQVPPFAVTQLFRIACDAHRQAEAFDAVVGVAPLGSDAVAHLLEDCAKRNDFELAIRVEKQAREEKVPLIVGSYDALLKLHTVRADSRVLELFQEMQDGGVRISEGLCVDALRERQVPALRGGDRKVVPLTRRHDDLCVQRPDEGLAYCGMYDKACDLYENILEDGLEPDSNGRTQLAAQLSYKAPKLDIQNYMSLIRAAGRDRDVDRAFDVLHRLKKSGVHIDVAAYNCVLDVCVSAGDMDRARRLVEDMRSSGPIDIITLNTLLKGYCAKADLAGARRLLADMERQGFRPNDVSYNCLVNASISAGGGNFRDAWETIDSMERSGVAVDHYTISIMMKALKKSNNSRDVSRALSLLDRSGIDVYSDEILLNSVLETCIHYRETRRLESILSSYHNSSIRPSVHTYGSLIKASSTLKRLPQCWEYWHEMVESRAMQPNEIVLGCMLDALVTNRNIEQAVNLLAKWKTRVPPNTVMYSTIIKGFANTHQAERAMCMWREMRAEKLKLNTVVYNAVIDAQARVGAMEEVSELVAMMQEDNVKPDIISHSTIVKGYCVKGDVNKAFEIFRDMQKNNMVKDSIVYNTLLDGCTRNSRFDLADVLLEDMEKCNITPTNFTMGILVKMYGRRKQLDRAFEAMETLPKRHGFAPNPQVKTCLVCACINNNALDRAFEVFDDLKSAGFGADAKAYSAIISGCVRKQQTDRAVALVEEAYGLNGAPPQLAQGQTIEVESLEKLLQALSQRGQAQEVAMPLLDRLRAAKAPISGRLYTSVLGGSMPAKEMVSSGSNAAAESGAATAAAAAGETLWKSGIA